MSFMFGLLTLFSAHWQGGPKKIKINVAGQTDLIYDFYGCPPHCYKYEYPSRRSSEVAEKVIEQLAVAGIEIERVQVSLYNNEDPDQHYHIGLLLESLRKEGILAVAAGMTVQNLRNTRSTLATGGTIPYAFSFDEVLKEAATTKLEERQAKVSALMRRSDGRKAHSSLEHILQIHVGIGAAGLDLGEPLWTFPEGKFELGAVSVW